MAQAFTSGRQSRGFALIAVLWCVVILSVISLAVLRVAKTDAKLANNTIAAAQAMALADAGVHRASLALLPDAFDDRWRADGRRYDWRFSDGRVLLTVVDEAGKIDLNHAEVALLKNLFLSLGLDKDRAATLADAVDDFRDQDNLTRLNGAEDRDYRVAGYRHGAKDDLFEHISELRQVFGMTPEILAKLRPLVTIYSASTAIDTWTAPAQVLQAIPDYDADEVSRILTERNEALTEAELEAIPLPSSTATHDFLDPGSGGYAFTVHSEGHSASGAVFVREAIILLDDSSSGFAIAEWRQGRR